MSVRAKFKVISIARQSQSVPERQEDGSIKYVLGEVHSVVLHPVTASGHDDPTDENKKFWVSTPTGNINLGICNPEVVKDFEINKCYYVDFTPAE